MSLVLRCKVAACPRSELWSQRAGLACHLFSSLASYIQLRIEKRGKKSRREVGEATDMAPRLLVPGSTKRRPSEDRGRNAVIAAAHTLCVVRGVKCPLSSSNKLHLLSPRVGRCFGLIPELRVHVNYMAVESLQEY